MNIFDQAMQLELDGEEFYQTLGDQVQPQGVKKIFLWLAADERKHYEIFRRLKESEPVVEMEASQVLESARNLFEKVLVSEASRLDLQTNLEAYQLAMKAEQESIDLYTRALEEQREPAVKQVLQQILVEERKHFTVLENIYDFVNKPNRSFVWGEFSNLDVD